MVLTLLMNVFAYAKYRHLSYDRLTSIVLILFLVSFSVRFTGYMIQDVLKIKNNSMDTLVSTLMPVGFALITIGL